MKYISSFAICLILTSSALANKEIAPYSQESCQEIYGAIGTFLYLADKEWKKENEKKSNVLFNGFFKLRNYL